LRLCKETITVINSQFNPALDRDVYHSTVIKGVSWFCETASAIIQSGLKSANKFSIRIPENADFGGKAYVNPITYSVSDPASTFTLKNGDIIIKGEVQIDDMLPADLQKQYADYVTILGVTDNRRALNAPHWKVVGA
jgi:hypothetical protein